MTIEEKLSEIAHYAKSSYNSIARRSAMKMAEWKDKECKEQLTAFAQHLNKRGAFRDDLCMDFEHEAQSFIELQKNEKL